MIKFPDRKVIQHGRSLFINIPALFVQHNELICKQKMSVEWDEKNNKLILKPSMEVTKDGS